MFEPRVSLTLLATLTLAAITGCGDGAPSAGTGATSSVNAALAAWQLDAEPAGAVEIVVAKASAKEGDTITLRGRIGGRMEPLTEASGLLVLMDPAVPSCADNPGDTCPTPWDYCCETSETIAAHAATVQVRSADGQPVALPAGAFSELDELVVVGTVAPRPNADTLVLHASGVYVASKFQASGHDGHDH